MTDDQPTVPACSRSPDVMKHCLAAALVFFCLASGLSAADEPPLLKAINLDKLNTSADETEPHLATDGLQLYYASTNEKGKADLFVSGRRVHSQSWPRGMLVDGYFAEEADNSDSCLTIEGRYPQYLYFATNRNPEKKDAKAAGFDIYVAVRQSRGAAFTAPTPVHG